MIPGIRLHRWCLALLLALCSIAYAQTSTRPVLLVLGDSLSAEYGLPRDSGWVKLLADKVATWGPKGAAQYNVVNASISGETTSGGRTRLPALLTQHHPAVVIIELGGNDGLRGLPNYGRDYTERFFGMFADVARERKASLAPFLLDGFADQTDLFQNDRIHPTVRAQQKMLDNVWPHLQPLLETRGNR